MAEDTKDTIYIDVDDEITTIIDKVRESKKKLVALVLPKRASVFQSIVNMKLLKRKSDEAGKQLVLVTTDTGLLPLAGAVGLHVAKTLSSKPAIPAAPVIEQSLVEAAEDESVASIGEEPEEEAQELKHEALKEINKSSKVKTTMPAKDLDTIELDNTEDNEAPLDTAMPAAAIANAEAKKKAKKNKKLKIPNFERFRFWTLLSISAIVILVVLWILLFKVFPSATIDIKTNAQNVNANLTFNMSTNASSLNTSTSTVPAKKVSETKSYTATVNATGQQNNGQKATGQVTFSLQDCSQNSVTIPAGTGITANNLTYITQSSVTLYSINFGGNCNPQKFSNYWSGSTNITALSGGSNYNTGNTTFAVPGYSGVSANGSASGGTDDIVTVVSQTDITNAQNKISQNTSSVKSDLISQLTSDNYYPINATFTASSPNISANASAGTAANSVTVTETISYTMYGVIKSDLAKLLDSNIKSQVSGNQNILSNGLASANFSVNSNPTSVSMTTNAVVGPNINVNTLKQEITGQKVSSIESIIKADPDVSSVSIKLSPFYVSQAPSASHITINIAKPTNNPNASNN